MKYCKWCKTEQPIENFHKHKKMKDGRINKCSSCVVASVAKWRVKNPDCRKKEHAKVRDKNGGITRDAYYKKRSQNAIGRKASASKYAHKRRLQKVFSFCSELDEFAFEEAFHLCQLREAITGFKWHVDHIVPLNHKNACGLHVAQNFQVIPAYLNCKKGNRNMNEYILGISGY